MSDPRTTTALGRVRGRTVADGVLRFAGIPYAAPPTGRGRFRPPAPAAAWAGERDAGAFAPLAPQHQSGPAARGRPEKPMSEDCLTLNVWTPATTGRRPVLVWFHGGGFAVGAAHDATTDGAALARAGDVVVVSVAHRLSMLGYLDLEELCGADYAGSGNAGMLDLIAALEWIRDNIAAFGGDPEAVTIHGHSGGGGKVATLCVMPAARGLFRGAIVHGGPPFGHKDHATATRNADRALQLLGIRPAQADALAEVPLARLLEVQWQLGVHGGPGPHGMRFAPTTATPALPVDPYTGLAAGMARDVRLMTGTALDESRAAVFAWPAYLDAAPMSDAELLARLRPGLDDPGDAERLVARYRMLDEGVRDGTDLFFAITSDQFRIRSQRLAGAQHAGGGSAWLYLCTVQGPTGYGSYHGVQMPLFFRTATAETPGAGVAARVSDELIRFAWEHGPLWPAWRPDDRRELVFGDDDVSVATDPYGARMAVWDGIPLTVRTDPWTTLWQGPAAPSAT